MSSSEAPSTVVGPLRLGALAHGGSCVARTEDGRVVFVRHGIPGEVVRVRLADTTRAAWWLGEVDEVVEASPDRIIAPVCPVAGRCGGCDLSHVALARQRTLKAEVVHDVLRRFAGLDVRVEVAPVPGETTGLHWRTRQRYLVADGRCGLRAWRSHGFVATPEDGCPLASPWLPAQSRLADLAARHGADEIAVAVDDEHRVSAWVGRTLVEGSPTLRQRVGAAVFTVPGDGFWQVHPGAATALAQAVVTALEPRDGEAAWDLYCGVGLFAGALAQCGATVHGVEISPRAVRWARRNVPSARFFAGNVERLVPGWPRRVGLVVLDPPRRGAGRAVVEAVAARAPRAVAYVACDPAALARDLAYFAGRGYRLDGLAAIDVFPQTHHVEAVARIVPA